LALNLVEVVDVEHEPSLGRRVRAEVRQMSVAGELDRQTGRRGLGEVGGHHQSGAAVEGER
jgi:hypothetical protein